MGTSRILLLGILGLALLSSVICNSKILEFKPNACQGCYFSEYPDNTFSSSDTSGPDDCCFTLYPRRLNKNLISSYYMTDHRCPKTGVM